MCLFVFDRWYWHCSATVTSSLNDINMIAHVGCFQCYMKLCWTNDLLGIFDHYKYQKENIKNTNHIVQRYVWHALFCVVANSQFFVESVKCRFRLLLADEFMMFIKVRTERNNWTALTWFSFWRTDQWASRTNLSVIGWRVGRLMLLTVMLTFWSVCEKLNNICQ